MHERSIIVIAHNLRSCYNVGSLFRTAEGLGVKQLILTGYTPYPIQDGDARLPHEARKLHAQIHKTALGAEMTLAWHRVGELRIELARLQADGYTVMALEQGAGSVALPTYEPPSKLVLVLGREAEGLETEVIALCDGLLEVPMRGQKESFNVVQAAAMALYHCCLMR